MNAEELDDSFDPVLDWEYTNEFYKDHKNGRSGVRSFEEIAAEGNMFPHFDNLEETLAINEDSSVFEKTLNDVKRIRISSVSGKNAEEIATQYQLDKQYVLNVLMTMEGYTEDDDKAVAHLVMLG